MKKIWSWITRHLPTKRRLIQLYAALLTNANLKGFATGKIYKGPVKFLCTPGLNCYSCPGAVASCPLGSLQNALAASKTTAPHYVIGIILLFGILLGRWICGFLCPMGLVQDLMYKIKTPKLKKGRITRVFSALKYVILAVFVVIIPLIYAFKDVPLPAFCKYICPAGTLEGAMGLLANRANNSMFAMLGPLFSWKFLLLISFLVGSVFIYRIFCRFVCPLGALYGLFNRIAILGIKLEKSKCVDCGLCTAKCKMDIRRVGDRECIQCGECIPVCPTKAITWKGGKLFLPKNEITPPTASDEEPAAAAERNVRAEKRTAKRNHVIRFTAAGVMLAVLAGVLVYFNFIHKTPETHSGNAVGDTCYSAELPLYNEGEGATINIAKTYKVTVINFWYTSCTPCVAELPHFNRIAAEYAGTVDVIAVHADVRGNVEGYIEENFPHSKIRFAFDENNEYYAALGGLDTYPMTLVLDENDIILDIFFEGVTYERLKDSVEDALN